MVSGRYNFDMLLLLLFEQEKKTPIDVAPRGLKNALRSRIDIDR